MECLLRGMGTTIKPKAATNAGMVQSSRWRCITFRDVHMSRINYLYAPQSKRITPAAQMVHEELLALTREEVLAGCWTAFKLIG